MHCKASANPIVRGVLRVEKKKINWLGWLSVLVLVPTAVILIYLGITTKNDVILISTVIGFMVALVFVPFFWIVGWRVALPDKRVWARLVRKSTGEKILDLDDGISPVTNLILTNLILTFELMDGSQVSYIVPLSKYKLFSENEMGILTYRAQGKKSFFVNFERQA